MPAPEWLELRWHGQLMGRITEIGWSDFPWAGGNLGPGEWPAEVQQSLKWYFCSEEEDGEQTFEYPAGVFDGWTLTDPTGGVQEIGPPKVDFEKGYMEWR